MPESILTRPPLFPLQFDAVCLAFAGKPVLKALTFQIQPRGITAIMGPNGAGKSLCLRLMAGLLQPDFGQIRCNGQVRNLAGEIGFVFQRPVLLRRSVKANLLHALKIAAVPKAQRESQVARLLKLGEMTAHADSPARKLSGGEQQRLALLRALAASPQVLLLDEPSASLDPHATFLIERLVKTVADSGVKVILVTHDQGQANRLAQEVIFLHQGRHIESACAKLFLNRPVSPEAQAYLNGQLLLGEEK